MTALRAARHSRPGRWLVAALVLDLLLYKTATAPVHGVALWALLDLWLAHRIWRSGPVALTVFRTLQTIGVMLFAVAVVAAATSDNVDTPATPLTIVLYAGSLWCLMAPALSAHVCKGGVTVPEPFATR